MPGHYSEIRLGILQGMSAYKDEQGRYLINHSIGRLLEELRRHIPATRVCMPILPQPNPSLNHCLVYPESNIVALPPLGSVMSAQKYYFPSRRVIRQFASSADALFIRIPLQLPGLLCGLRKPKVLHIAGNTRAVIAVSSDYLGPMKWLARAFAWFSENRTIRSLREPNSRVVSNGTEMWNQLGCRAGRVVVSSCLYRREMEPRHSTQLDDPPRLLFVGYLRPEKGAHTLLDAFDAIRRHRPLKLTLAGGMDRSSNAEELIRQRVAASEFRDDIVMTGMVDFGPDLFALYKDHDIFIVPSLSEGTPRTLVEARAFGCPVIASRVGGIPDSVRHEHDGLLFQPGNAEDLAHCITRILDDEPLRKTLMDEGFRSSERRSLENFGAELACEIAALFNLPGPPVESVDPSAIVGA